MSNSLNLTSHLLFAFTNPVSRALDLILESKSTETSPCLPNACHQDLYILAIRSTGQLSATLTSMSCLPNSSPTYIWRSSIISQVPTV